MNSHQLLLLPLDHPLKKVVHYRIFNHIILSGLLMHSTKYYHLLLIAIISFVPLQGQTPELAQAKAKLAKINKELAQLDAHYDALLTSAIRARANLAPKYEFESTDEYDKRIEAGRKISDEMRPDYEGRKSSQRLKLETQVEALKSTPYIAPIRIRLGQYNADTQLFKFEVRATGDSGTINLPLNIAEDARLNIATLQQSAYWELISPDKSTLRATSLIYGETKYFGLIGEVDTTDYAQPTDPVPDSLTVTIQTPDPALIPSAFLGAIGYRFEGTFGLPGLPPILSATATFATPASTTLMGRGSGTMAIQITNSGHGAARGIRIITVSESPGLIFPDPRYLGTVNANESRALIIDINSTTALATGTADINISFTEANGFQPDPIILNIPTQKLVAPTLSIAEFAIDDANANGMIDEGELVTIVTRIKNNGPGSADALRASLVLGDNVFFTKNQPTAFVISDLNPGSTTDLSFEIFSNRQATEVPVTINFTQIQGLYELPSLTLDLPFKESATKIQQLTVAPSSATTPSPSASALAIDIEENIPVANVAKPDAVALIIANRNYANRDIPMVKFAHRDGEFMRQYLVTTLGYSDENIIVVQDATLGNMKTALQQLANAAKKRKAVFVYYTGHGAPDPESKSAFFVPVDSDPNYVANSGFALTDFYAQLANIKASAITVVVDACFSGGSDQGMIIRNISPVYLEVDDQGPVAKHITVFSSSSGEEVSSWYPEKQHSLYTYFFLKGIQGEADADADRTTTVGEMQTYLEGTVTYAAKRRNNRQQTPQVTAGRDERVLVQFK